MLSSKQIYTDIYSLIIKLFKHVYDLVETYEILSHIVYFIDKNLII